MERRVLQRSCLLSNSPRNLTRTKLVLNKMSLSIDGLVDENLESVFNLAVSSRANSSRATFHTSVNMQLKPLLSMTGSSSRATAAASLLPKSNVDTMQTSAARMPP